MTALSRKSGLEWCGHALVPAAGVSPAIGWCHRPARPLTVLPEPLTYILVFF